jgi:hypothetical protein
MVCYTALTRYPSRRIIKTLLNIPLDKTPISIISSHLGKAVFLTILLLLSTFKELLEDPLAVQEGERLSFDRRSTYIVGIQEVS